MKRVLLICLSLVLALVGWSAVGAADDGFYVIPSVKRNYAPVPKTGQTTSYDTRDDGDLEKGVAWPTPRFTDNGNGTVTDNLTKLIWTKNANGFLFPKYWADATSLANILKSGDAGLTDGSKAGDWRLPNLQELESLIDYGSNDPNAKLPAGHPFNGVQEIYWTSTTLAWRTTDAYMMYFVYFPYVGVHNKQYSHYVWCVRGGK